MSNKTPPADAKALIKLLLEAGFILDHVKGSHHIYKFPDGSRRVIVPVHRSDLPKGTMHGILKQAGLD